MALGASVVAVGSADGCGIGGKLGITECSGVGILVGDIVGDGTIISSNISCGSMRYVESKL